MKDNFASLATALAAHYRIERELGAGGMATVYLAEDLKHHRKVAVKVLKPELAAVLGAERFVQEIATTAALQHPHILPLFDSGEASGFLYYVMPFIDGETLRTKLDRETQLGIDSAVKISVAIADALDYAHRHGVVHRDIKPENILLQEGRPMVADFGIALAVSAAAGGRVTETGLSLGTPHYMSPEQATAEKEITGRSDIYSLGSVLYEMLAGQPPHLGGSAQQIIMKIVTAEAAPVTTLRRAVPLNVAAAVAKSLEKIPADRFESAKAFADALQNSGFTTAVATGAAAGATARASYRRTAPLAAVAVLALAFAGWGWMRATPTIEPTAPWQTRLILPDSAPIGSGFSLSADGSVLVYDGRDRLWMRRARSADPIPIAGGDGAGWPSISPDGRRVAFLRRGLEVLPLSGGEPRVVAPSSLGTSFGWIDDEHVALPAPGGLLRQPIAGGDAEPLTKVDSSAGELFHVSSSGLPNGKGVLFTIVGRDPDSSMIATVGPRGGVVTHLLPGLMATYAPPAHLIVTRADGSIVAVPFDIDRRTLTGPPVALVTGLRTGSFSTVGLTTVSNSGRLLYVAGGATFEAPSELVWIDHSGRVAPIGTGWTGLFQSAALSPDGRRTAVGEYFEKGEDLLVRDLASGSITRVSVPQHQLRNPAFSADGRQLYFAAEGRSMSIMRVEVSSGATPERVIEFRKGTNGVSEPSQRGEQIYYSVTTAGEFRIARRSLSTTKVETNVVPRSGVARPQPSPDGRWVAFLSRGSANDELRVRSTDLTSQAEWLIHPSVDRTSMVRWSRAGDELYYVARDSMRATHVSTSSSFEVGATRALFRTAGLKPSFDVGADGRFLMIRWRTDLQRPSELMMLERWQDLLPR